MVKTLNFREELIKRLKDPEYSAVYLNAALAEGEQMFLLALKDVLEAQGGMGAIAKRAGLNRESMYKTLSGERDPYLSTVTRMLDSIGIELKVSLKQQPQ